MKYNTEAFLTVLVLLLPLIIGAMYLIDGLYIWTWIYFTVWQYEMTIFLILGGGFR